MIELGQKVKDIVSDFTGIVISRVVYLNGCVQYGVRPRAKKGNNKMPEATYIDEGQLEVVGKGLMIAKKENGGPVDCAPNGRSSDMPRE